MKEEHDITLEELGSQSFVEGVLESYDAEYLSTLFVPPTSVLVESTFSVAGHVWTDRRASTLPHNVEEQMFLKFNRRFWDVRTVQKVHVAQKVSPATDRPINK